jgi:hypothetical protein
MIDVQRQELSVRTDASGGGLTAEVQPGPDHGPLGHGRLILLFHGYANDLTSARGSYTNFITNLQKDWPRAGALLPDIFRFYWPGDKSWSIFSFLSYPLEIGPAQGSAQLLAEYLADVPGPNGGMIDVYLIAHSLGNRVAMELLQIFSAGELPGHVNVKGACLMAAAVPVSKVDAGGDLHSAATFTRFFVLFSPGDGVLHFAFPPGETAAGDAFFPTAVGRFGQPLNQWANKQLMTYGAKSDLYGHHDYWKRDETITPIQQFLDPSTPKEPIESVLPTHLMPLANELPHVGIPDRPLPDRAAIG